VKCKEIDWWSRLMWRNFVKVGLLSFI